MMSDSDSDATYIEEEDNDPGNGPSLSEATTSQKTESYQRSVSVHDISDSDSEDGKASQSLLGKSKEQHTVNSSQESASSSKTYKIPKRKSSSSSETRQTLQDGNSKPQCQYAAKCYRKNVNHRKEFRHLDDEDEMPPTKRVKRDNSASSFSASYPTSSSSSSSSSRKKNCLEVVKESSPLCFLLTKVSGIQDKYNNSLAVHISDILSPCMGELVASAQFNYMFDIPWLIQQYPSRFRSKPLLIVHGEQRQSKTALHEAAHPYPNIKLCQAKLDIMYGTHHSKMMLLLYTNGMRVIVHTANMIERDWYQKTQGVWISPLFPKAESSSVQDSSTSFQHDLVEYLTAYRSPTLQEWTAHIKKHDMSQAKVYIISSVPGRHLGSAINKWGHLKLRQVLKEDGPTETDVRGWHVIGQFSSVGSLGPDKDKWLCSEWLQSMAQCRGAGGKLKGESGHKTLKLIFPSKDNVRTSLEGYPAGGSIPYSINTAKKQIYFNSFLHQWISNTRGRSRASPHIKTYCRLSPDSQSIAWFLVTSANMSKAAWGALEKNGQQLMIRSYEIGVLFVPKHFVADSTKFVVSESASSNSSKEELFFPLPWDVPPVLYTKDDRPWLWDIPYTDLPDSHGNCWVPPS